MGRTSLFGSMYCNCSVGISVNLKFLPKCVIIHHEGLALVFNT